MLDVRALLLGLMALMIATYGLVSSPSPTSRQSPDITGSIPAQRLPVGLVGPSGKESVK